MSFWDRTGGNYAEHGEFGAGDRKRTFFEQLQVRQATFWNFDPKESRDPVRFGSANPQPPMQEELPVRFTTKWGALFDSGFVVATEGRTNTQTIVDGGFAISYPVPLRFARRTQHASQQNESLCALSEPLRHRPLSFTLSPVLSSR